MLRAVLVILLICLSGTASAMSLTPSCVSVGPSEFVDLSEAAGFSREALAQILEEADYAADFASATTFCVQREGFPEEFTGKVSSDDWTYMLRASSDEDTLNLYRMMFRAPPLGRDGDVVLLVYRRADQ